MAGGMSSRPQRAPSLAERTGGRAAARAGPHRHCWVVDGEPGAVRAAGLLVEWRQLAGGWQGRVAYVVDVEGAATLVEAWVPAVQLERASPA